MQDTPKIETIAEATLCRIIAATAEDAAYAVTLANGYPEPSAEDWAQMRQRQHNAIAEIVAGMRNPAVMPPDLADIRAVIRGLAEGVVLAVMGQPPATRCESN